MSERDAFVVRTEATLSGDSVEVQLTVDLPPSVHIEPHQPVDPYLIPTVLEVEGLDDATVDYPEPVVKDLGWNDVMLTVLEGTLAFVVRGRVRDRSPRVFGTLRYQPCVGGACLPPRTIAWEAPVSGSTSYSVLHAVAA